MTGDSVLHFDLSTAELAELESLLTELNEAGHDPGREQLHDQAWALTARLPAGLREFLENFRLNDPAAAFMIRGLPVDDTVVGPTPAHWSAAASSIRTRREELFASLIGNCLGDVFSWSTLQDGRMVHNVLPVAGEEQAQSGHGSDALLEWHTEDGFHPHRCDYLGLFGVRNHDRVPTVLASIRDVDLPDGAKQVLSERRFHILPDNEHLQQLAERKPIHPGLLRMRQMRENPEPVAVLFGATDSPYLRIDPYFMTLAEVDDDAAQALKLLITELDRVRMDLVVEPGCMLVVDNYLAVHGRRAFQARYDGTDRWLKKVIVTRDLRKSRGDRDGASTRVLI
jgi:Fe(II)/alpha-ketoglutarate-dependent arginine beta-hydroxylase